MRYFKVQNGYIYIYIYRERERERERSTYNLYCNGSIIDQKD